MRNRPFRWYAAVIAYWALFLTWGVFVCLYFPGWISAVMIGVAFALTMRAGHIWRACCRFWQRRLIARQPNAHMRGYLFQCLGMLAFVPLTSPREGEPVGAMLYEAGGSTSEPSRISASLRICKEELPDGSLGFTVTFRHADFLGVSPEGFKQYRVVIEQYVLLENVCRVERHRTEEKHYSGTEDLCHGLKTDDTLAALPDDLIERILTMLLDWNSVLRK